jgi:flagellar hook protein FlgE
VNAAGLYLQGWQADTNGNVTTDPSNLSLLQPINVSTIVHRWPVPTSQVVHQRQPAIEYGGVPGGAGRQRRSCGGTDAYSADATAVGHHQHGRLHRVGGTTGTKPDFTMQIPLSNTEGGTQTVQLDFLKSSNGQPVVHGSGRRAGVQREPWAPACISGQIAKGTIAFTDTGQFDPINTTLPLSLAFGASSAGAPGATGANWVRAWAWAPRPRR